METTSFIEALRFDIKTSLREEILAELQPEIERMLHANIFDFEEAWRYLKVSSSTLRRMVKNNEIPFFKQRGNVYFRQIDINSHISRILIKNGA
ncbi:helix-turn-helix domain-containing protein [Paenibacillus macquariensis]|uniref:DNA binding domain-containing protein, excisionase family n=1 Tax=Paenibacillus macquariensis TaxID=948756 RepID=A0ABY1JS33_9BACL|nr:helix-turn-helix domain-containing protein [Paenibacillus macquariensis]MEC0092857.1 helix-turn-helix domain-containing protein [Paenibacillus macquariensis]OAB36236.1 hypothetical protein PMSM_07240 [Paenibacillus macquariensis subsp. macquariensis]SIQ67643.1 DNA binding domain-containing protein, excisionase family [Paenibacillus macquariensis]